MSRQNKVNPGTYTQRGRLTPDDAARELRKQRVIASPHTWQPVDTRFRPRLPPVGGGAAGESSKSAGGETMAETRPRAETRATAKAAPSKATAKAAKAKTGKAALSKRTTGKAKAGKATTARKRTTAKPARKAARARKAGGDGGSPRPTSKRRRR